MTKTHSMAELRPIELLPESVANQIAAGEVVQRPASAVKELMENAIDAGGTRIEVNIQQAGKRSIQVIDNGHGIPEGDVPLAFARHATSKLRQAKDLFALETMGFRGEALASIAAVSQLELVTRTADESSARQLSNHGGELGDITKTAAPVGTKITVEHLYYNVPARRQFLKSDPVEFKHISQVFASTALAHPEVGMTLKHNGDVQWALDPGSPRQRVAAVLGQRVNERLVPVDESTDVVTVSGFVLRPEQARKTRGDQYLVVNHRPVRNHIMHKAIVDAFEGLIHPDHHPAYVLHMTVPADRVDVNVHPAKTEIKFEDERAISAILRSAVKRALGIHQVAPTLDFENHLSQHITPAPTPGREVPPPTIQVDPHYNPFKSTEKSKDFFATPSNVPSADQQGSLELDSKWEQPVAPTTPVSNSEPISIPPHFAVMSMRNSLVTVHLPRAKRRILFDTLLDQLQGGQVASQSWLFPQNWSPPSKADWSQWEDRIAGMGYQWSIDGDQWTWESGPYFMSPELAIDWLAEVVQCDPDTEDWGKALVTKWLDSLEAIPDPVQGQSLKDILDRLFESDNPWQDDRLKPVARILDAEGLAAQFAT